jgi:elongation factor G
VQPQTLTVDKQMKRYDVPRLIFINKLDRLGADPWSSIQGVRDRLSLCCAAVQINIGIENGLEGVVDLIRMKAYYFDGDSGDVVREEEIPEKMMEEVIEKKLELIGTLAEHDEAMEEHYLEENHNVDPEEMKACIRKHTINLNFCPVFMGSAFKNKGVQPLLDGVVDYLPKPTEVKNYAHDLTDNEKKVLMEIDSKMPFVGLAFKLEETQYGQLTWIRVYQGMLKKGATLMNTSTNKKCKISRMVRMHSADIQDINEAGPGDIFALFGVDCASGETFCDMS